MRTGPLFVPIYLASVLLAYFALTPEQTGNFERSAKQFRVMAFRDGKPVPTTLAALAQRDPALRFLLPGREVDLPGGDLHRAVVTEKGADWQLVTYEFGNTISSTSRYRAFADRVDPISHRVTFHPGLLVALLVLMLPAWLVAFLAAWAWRRLRRARAPSGS